MELSGTQKKSRFKELLKNRMEMVTNVNFHRNEKPADDVRISKVSTDILLVRIKRKSLKNLE